ncbi:hypothetical protein CRG98_008969, partial [Punica granatum]
MAQEARTEKGHVALSYVFSNSFPTSLPPSYFFFFFAVSSLSFESTIINCFTSTRPSSLPAHSPRRLLRFPNVLLNCQRLDPPPPLLIYVPLIYSPAYDIAFLGIEKLHPFDSSKWGRICHFLISEGIVEKKWIIEPLEASKDDLLVVHSESYLNSLKWSGKVAMIVEVPPVALIPNCLVQQKVLHPFRKQVGGTILAAKLAKERGWAIN